MKRPITLLLALTFAPIANAETHSTGHVLADNVATETATNKDSVSSQKKILDENAKIFTVIDHSINHNPPDDLLGYSQESTDKIDMKMTLKRARRVAKRGCSITEKSQPYTETTMHVVLYETEEIIETLHCKGKELK